MAADTVLARFTIGQGKALPIDHVGPKSYTTNGNNYGSANNQTGITVAGLSTIDFIVGGPAISGNYFAYPIKSTAGEQKVWKLVIVTATSGVPTTTQATSTTDLSAETFPLLVIGR